MSKAFASQGNLGEKKKSFVELARGGLWLYCRRRPK